MPISAKARRVPLRLTTGAFILNSGISKFSADDETAKQLQTTATALTPRFERIEPQTFAKALSVGEVALGAALLTPAVPTLVAGAGLSVFAGSLLTMWWRTPGMHAESSPRPTPQGVPIAKDVWMLGSGVSLVIDALTTPAHDKRVELSATAHEKVAAKKRRLRSAAGRAQVGEKAHEVGARLHEAAEEYLQDAGERLAELRDEYQPVAAKKLKKAKKKARKQTTHLAEVAREKAHDAGTRVQQAVA
ncbi:MAG: hypothetical protein ACJ71Z_01035 [Aeromicrobium sp.]